MCRCALAPYTGDWRGVQALFSPYYAHVMPPLKAILQRANGKSQRVLCGKAVECVSLVGMSVGRDVFYSDAQARQPRFVFPSLVSATYSFSAARSFTERPEHARCHITGRNLCLGQARQLLQAGQDAVVLPLFVLKRL